MFESKKRPRGNAVVVLPNATLLIGDGDALARLSAYHLDARLLLSSSIR